MTGAWHARHFGSLAFPPVAFANSAAFGSESWASVCAWESCHAFFAILWQPKHRLGPTYSWAATPALVAQRKTARQAARRGVGRMTYDYPSMDDRRRSA